MAALCLRFGIVLPKNFSIQRNLFAAKYFSDDSEGKNNNPYKTLGISSSANNREIKKAYYDLTLKYHPDRNENCDVAATKFREVAEAYEILGNYSLRKKYDQGIPVSMIKKKEKNVVPHEVKHQAFYDSRAVQSTFVGKVETENNYSNTKFSNQHVKDSVERSEFQRKKDSSSHMHSFKRSFRAYLNQKKRIHLTAIMPKKKNKCGESKATELTKDKVVGSKGSVYVGTKKEIILKIHAKPGAKESAVTGVDEEAIGVQIGAPPVDGEANKELIRYLAEVLNLRKSDLTLDKGSRSKEKIVIISKEVTVDNVVKALNAACK